MIIDEPDAGTEAVLQAMAQGNDPRLKDITSAFVRHACFRPRGPVDGT